MHLKVMITRKKRLEHRPLLFLFDMSRVEETLKDYAIKALVNTVDHLGSVAYKVNNFLDEKMGGICGMQLRLSCLEQVPSQGSLSICKC